MNKPSIPSTAVPAWCITIWTSRSARVVLVVAVLIVGMLAVTLFDHLSAVHHVTAGGNSWGWVPTPMTRGRTLHGSGQGLFV